MSIRRVVYLTAIFGALTALAGCAFSFFNFERRAPWHDAEERACLMDRSVLPSAYIQASSGIDQGGVCGIWRPLHVSAMANGTVQISPTATLNCPMTAAVEGWLRSAVQPAALAWFGAPVVEIKQISSYACRPRDNIQGEKLSEHAFGNAIDVAGFELANGRTITVKTDWLGDPDDRGFLREVFSAACQRFKTVLGPGVQFHGDHFHLDLAHHDAAGTSRFCDPRPDGPPPNRVPYDGGLISRADHLLDFRTTGSIAPAPQPGPLLNSPPADTIDTELSDPFGVYDTQAGQSGAE